ncbi:hypothetical protein P691DRAFT_776789 [Macrolepiota fuliginosa MF-IS2]|uniref:BTB domain-containing protein n=1 Tax=Macrolepiota fuliginosa MF-IS2 TaxID=1400762 RepID=A0A9P5XAS0_9AGAR|nr:hypothetical protein P691DRAFT_776789 [Macrolepiota fuliginosa MF-IS2]
MDSSSLTSISKSAMDFSSLTSMPQVTYHTTKYYMEPLVLLVENTFFRVPREYLLQQLPTFLGMFVTDSEGVGSEGATDTKPLTLPDTITASSFRALLQVLYPLDRPAKSEMCLSKDHWIALLELSSLELSRQSAMIRIRRMANEHLVSLLDDDPAHKWNLANKYGVRGWVLPALKKLVRRNRPLGNREFEMLDQETLLKLGAIRESCYPVLHDSDPGRYGYYDNENTTIGHWDIRQQRGQINVDLDSTIFTCPTPSEHSADPVLVPATDSPKRNGEFYVEKVVFQVEDNLYKVSNQPFSQHSPFFRRCFESRGFIKFDHCDPLVIDADVTKTDFECLLRFFFPPKLSGEWEPTSTQWASILRLSEKWGMDEVKSLAAQRMENLNSGDVVTKLRMAQELGIQDWFASGMKMLVTRQEPLSARECQVLKSHHILRVLDLRERAHHRARYLNHRIGSEPVTHIRPERGEIPNNGYDLNTKLIGLF